MLARVADLPISGPVRETNACIPFGVGSVDVLQDITYIVGQAWANSFARVENNKKAIAERGWGPLTYVLLGDDRLIKFLDELDLSDKNVVDDLTTRRNLLDINTINQTGVKFNSTLDLLLEEQAKCKGRKRKHEEQMKQNISRNDKIDD